MPGSYDFFNNEVKQFVEARNPKRILDVGPGEGKYGKMFKVVGRDIEAVEIFAPYVTQYNLTKLYDRVHIQDIRTFWCTWEQYDIAILGDVLEHLVVKDAEKLLEFFTKKNIPILVLIPYSYVQGISHGNEHEVHEQSDLTEELFHQRYPGFIKLASNKYQGVFFKDKKDSPAFETFCKNTLIAVTTHNRPKSTELTLHNLSETKRQATLWVYDDASTELTAGQLQAFAPEAKVITRKNNLGINLLRFEIQLNAWKTELKYIYHTDNDAIHDPFWLNRLFEMNQMFPGLLSVYNTQQHNQYQLVKHENLNFVTKAAAPGISFFYPQNRLVTCREWLLYCLQQRRRSWDFEIGDMLGTAAVSSVSYVEHFGVGGIHNSDFERDRASNPTPWLQANRASTIEVLKAK